MLRTKHLRGDGTRFNFNSSLYRAKATKVRRRGGRADEEQCGDDADHRDDGVTAFGVKNVLGKSVRRLGAPSDAQLLTGEWRKG